MSFKLAVARMSNPFKISYHVTFDPVQVETWSDIIGDMYYSTSRDISILLSNYLFFLSDQTFLLPSKRSKSKPERRLTYVEFQMTDNQLGLSKLSDWKKWKNEFYRLINLGKMRRYKIIHIASSRESYDIHVHVYLIFS